MALVCVAGFVWPIQAAKPESAQPASPKNSASDVAAVKLSSLAAARKVDECINAELKTNGSLVAPQCSDEDFLRRINLDISGTSPTPQQVTLFGLDSDPNKREKLINRLLESPEYAQNWSRYWRDVIFLRATEPRANIVRPTFEKWMAEQLARNAGWDKIVTEILTATGDASESGNIALILAQGAQPAEVAAEASRIFLGVQIQCANCHDHPTDRWKREQFHELAAFFPRMRLVRNMQVRPPEIKIESVKPTPGGGDPGERLKELIADPDKLIRLLDRNGDQKISKAEAERAPRAGKFLAQVLARGDTDKDGMLSAKEIRDLPVPMRTGRGTTEYFMPDLDNPQSRGKQINPAFFLVSSDQPKSELGDLERRTALAKFFTATTNEWFAKALVNRVWGELLGEAFFMPVDDIGPDRTPQSAAALEALSKGFTASGYDLKWLFRAITNSEAYQRKIRSKDPKKSEAFASANPQRLRADQLYTSLLRVVGIDEAAMTTERQRMQGTARFADQSPRGQFGQLFGFDPSTPPDEQNGTIPQALFMMNAPQINAMVNARGNTRLADLIKKYPNDKDAVIELYLLVHAREPSAKELKVCEDYITGTKNRPEAFEDLLWSLLNSTEFLSKR